MRKVDEDGLWRTITGTGLFTIGMMVIGHHTLDTRSYLAGTIGGLAGPILLDGLIAFIVHVRK